MENPVEEQKERLLSLRFYLRHDLLHDLDVLYFEGTHNTLAGRFIASAKTRRSARRAIRNARLYEAVQVAIAALSADGPNIDPYSIHRLDQEHAKRRENRILFRRVMKWGAVIILGYIGFIVFSLYSTGQLQRIVGY